MITGASGFLTWTVIRSVPAFADPIGDWYVENPIAVTILACVIAAIIAGAFMCVFDQVGDSLLFCFALERRVRMNQTTRGGLSQKGLLQSCFACRGKQEVADAESGEQELSVCCPPKLRSLLAE